ncbi:hypothetical protein A2U01_0106579, partial [Trifolium medium]|nr:hypothetical protein [Trifolium medium]
MAAENEHHLTASTTTEGAA